MDTRNPSPPPCTDSACEMSDHIGESTYSKRWLYTLILQVLTAISTTEDAAPAIEDSLESSLEEELCCLWDITSDQSLLPHLREFQLIPVFTECIHRSKCPRLIEISLGILANLSLDDVECSLISEEPGFMTNTLALLASDDTRVLIELFRLLRSVLASRLHRQAWLDSIHFAPEFIDRVNFILCSSTNASLLMSTISAVETILRIDDNMCELWCNDDLLNSLQEAQNQMCWIYGDEVEIIYRILYLFSTNSTGVRTLMSSYYRLYPGFGVFLRKICEEEPHLIPFEKYTTGLRLILPVIDVIMTNLPSIQSLKAFTCDVDILPCLFKIALGCSAKNFASGDLSLEGLWSDLSILFNDLVSRVQEYVQACYLIQVLLSLSTERWSPQLAF
uniref:Protein SAAL1 n=1 Tax=Mesocestoides corti TaxID=53468 RepID=A0A5K3FGJ8_MESCO